MTELWLIRHGQTDWNVDGRLQGQTDIPLNETGLTQARELAARLGEQAFRALYSSDLRRAAQTARVIGAALRLEVQLHRGLREICFGEWEGQTPAEIRQCYPQIIAERHQHPLDTRSPGGETDREVARRVAAAADEIVRAHPVGPVLVVSHGRALALLTCLACGYPLETVQQHGLENAIPRVVEWRNQQ
jgi:2,3-bisphosphoglycerate-dependent phosphoglycerate mutase